MRRLLTILIVAPLALGGVAHAMRAGDAVGEQTFALSISPSAQTTVRGSSVSFSVDVLRAAGFAGPVRLGVGKLPPWVRARWRLADGTKSSVLGAGDRGATLTLTTPVRTRLGTSRLTVSATGDGHTRQRTLLLTVARPAGRRFSLAVSPPHRVVQAGDTARFKVRVARADTFRGSVRLRVLGVPLGAQATLRSSVLTIVTGSDAVPGAHRLVVEGSSPAGGRLLQRYAIVVLTTLPQDRPRVDGDPTTRLFPGAHAPIDLVLTNPRDFDVRVTTLRVRVRTDTSQPGCRGDTHYAVTQYAGAYPLALPRGATRLSALVRDPSLWPQISMRNLTTSQDACRGAVVDLDYSLGVTR